MLCKVVGEGRAADVQPVQWGVERTPPVPRQALPEPASSGDADTVWQTRLAQAQREGEERAREQHRQGYQEGMKAGGQAAAEALQPVQEELARSLGEIAGLRARLRREAEADLVKLALAIARRILRRELSVDPEALMALVRHAIERVNGRDVSRVRTHPNHAASIRHYLAQQQTAVTVEPDSALAPGAVVFDTAMGTLDASVDTQLAEIESGLMDHLGGAG